MSNYYQYEDVKVMIAVQLMKMDGWKVYGYSPDNSDWMTEYYDPAYWKGIAEKNGYILCVDQYAAAKPEEIREYPDDENPASNQNVKDAEKIKKLQQMTVARGASEQEEATAKSAIARLQRKAVQERDAAAKYTVVGYIPGHMANPPRSNWHIEKDGVIVAKGNGLLKYASIERYYTKGSQDLIDFRTKSEEAYKAELTRHYMPLYDTAERAAAQADRYYNELKEVAKLADSFDKFIRKIDSTCGGMIGSDKDAYEYRKVQVTQYKDEIKAVETTSGSIKEGQCFIVKGNFNYGHFRGYVYRIHEYKYPTGKTYFQGIRLNPKRTKELTGNSNPGNHWIIFDQERFMGWIEKGSLSWCELQEIKVPYVVEKVEKIKKHSKAARDTMTGTAAAM